MESLFDWLTHEISNNPATYAIVFAAAATDVLFPLVPSETIVIAAAVIAAGGGLLIFAIVPAAALGAFLGDNVAYLLGKHVGDPAVDRFFRGEKARERLRWAETSIRERGVWLIVVGRFIPGGRTATTVASGTLGMPYRRFGPADAGAAVIWSVYVSMLGYIGGSTFEDNLWLPLLLAFAFASLVAAGVEGWRRLRRRQDKEALGDRTD